MDLLHRSLRIAIATLPLLPGFAALAGEPVQPVPARDLSQIEETIAAKEYEASPNGAGLQAPNRAHNLRTWFDASGIRVHDRTAEGSPELLGLSLSGVGR